MKSNSTTKTEKNEKDLNKFKSRNIYTSAERNDKKINIKTVINPENIKKIKFSDIEQNLHEIKILYEKDVKNKEKISLIISIFILFYERQTLFLNIKIVYFHILQKLRNHPEQIVSTTYYKSLNKLTIKIITKG